ncbi:MAG: hypothetical protein PVG17_16975 [Desulfobacterales bacterium]|jgi:hypothetical protein
MNLTRNHLPFFCLTILLWLGAYISPAGAQSTPHLNLDFNRIPWSQLSFRAANFWAAVSSEIQLSRPAASELDAVLLKTPRGNPIQPASSQAARITIHTTIDHRLQPPVTIYNRIWFDPTDAAALGRIRVRRGQDEFKKEYRFTDQGVFRHRIEPQNKKEASLEPEKWTDVKDSFYPFDRFNLGCDDVSERSLLIYILSAAPLVQNDKPLSVCVFGKRALHRVTLQKTDTRSIAIDYVEKNRQAETRRKGHVMATEVAISAEAIKSGQLEAENFSFLGFQEDISIHIDPVSHLPIQISGVIPAVGKTHLKLNSVKINPHPH